MEGRSVRKTSNKLMMYRRAVLESMKRRFEFEEETENQRLSE